MITYIKIKCGYCGNKWNVSEGDNWKSTEARTCPACKEEVDETIWNSLVIPGFCYIADANRELQKWGIKFKMTTGAHLRYSKKR